MLGVLVLGAMACLLRGMVYDVPWGQVREVIAGVMADPLLSAMVLMGAFILYMGWKLR